MDIDSTAEMPQDMNAEALTAALDIGSMVFEDRCGPGLPADISSALVKRLVCLYVLHNRLPPQAA